MSTFDVAFVLLPGANSVSKWDGLIRAHFPEALVLDVPEDVAIDPSAWHDWMHQNTAHVEIKVWNFRECNPHGHVCLHLVGYSCTGLIAMGWQPSSLYDKLRISLLDPTSKTPFWKKFAEAHSTALCCKILRQWDTLSDWKLTGREVSVEWVMPRPKSRWMGLDARDFECLWQKHKAWIQERAKLVVVDKSDHRTIVGKWLEMQPRAPLEVNLCGEEVEALGGFAFVLPQAFDHMEYEQICSYYSLAITFTT